MRMQLVALEGEKHNNGSQDVPRYFFWITPSCTGENPYTNTLFSNDIGEGNISESKPRVIFTLVALPGA